MYKSLLAISFLLFATVASAITQVNINIINRKGIDNNLVLTNEHHSANLFERDKPIIVEMKNGIVVDLKLLVKKRSGEKYFVIDGKISEGNRLVGKLVDGKNDHLYYDKEKTYVLYDKNEQVIEVRIEAFEIVGSK